MPVLPAVCPGVSPSSTRSVLRGVAERGLWYPQGLRATSFLKAVKQGSFPAGSEDGQHCCLGSVKFGEPGESDLLCPGMNCSCLSPLACSC